MIVLNLIGTLGMEKLVLLEKKNINQFLKEYNNVCLSVCALACLLIYFRVLIPCVFLNLINYLFNIFILLKEVLNLIKCSDKSFYKNKIWLEFLKPVPLAWDGSLSCVVNRSAIAAMAEPLKKRFHSNSSMAGLLVSGSLFI